ncbi:hypothetical protein LTR37_006322 [Vermiconidia calcicola]|uniref:Uncharacterized protein n=1 Tax=Vermiconidia calcicola TaxID=1690605 RepID=A0ACC3NGU4_9PEZI|nr:hypothetical protein LTR37_006322 [Vermiconidia calcicola]
MYYLHTFLNIIGWEGRQSLRSLNFDWKLPEEEAHALGLYTSARATYVLLSECRMLTSLSVELDVVNMLTWQEDGDQRPVPFSYIHEIPHIELMYSLRGLKDITIGWKNCQGLEGMEGWAKTLGGCWRLDPNTYVPVAMPIDAVVETSNDRLSSYVHWTADDGRLVEV